MTINRATQNEVVLPYSPLIKDTTIQALNRELERHKQFLTQYSEKVIPRPEHQELLQKYKELAVIEYGTHSKLRMEKKKTEKLRGQLQKALEQTKEICSVYSDALSCRSSTKNYDLFLLELYLLLKVRAIWFGQPFEFTIVFYLINYFRVQKDNVRCFLCELYMHNFFWKNRGMRTLVLLLGMCNSKLSYPLLGIKSNGIRPIAYSKEERMV